MLKITAGVLYGLNLSPVHTKSWKTKGKYEFKYKHSKFLTCSWIHIARLGL